MQQHSPNSPTDQARNGQKKSSNALPANINGRCTIEKPESQLRPKIPTLCSHGQVAMKLNQFFVLPLIATFVVLCSPIIATAQRYQTKQHEDRVDLLQDGQLVTSYQFQSGPKPIVWPLIGPGQSRMTREYPMVDSKNEDHDHPHHRSLWMTFGEVNDIDFWAEGDGENKGQIVHQKILSLEESEVAATVTARHHWQTKTGQRLLDETCRYSLVPSTSGSDDRSLDCEYVLQHPEGGSTEPIHFGDTKEGMFAIRVPEAMKADKKMGQIRNSQGQLDRATWGQSARWVDYAGKATEDAESDVGIAILVHPQSFGNEGYWHVRTYGLFAHNPIGVAHFLEVNPKATKKVGGFLLEAGQKMHLFYRVVLHRGRWTAEEGDRQYEIFTKSRPQLD